MQWHWLVAIGLAVSACGTIITHEKDTAAPQNYRPPKAVEQWLIEGDLDTEIHTDKATGAERIAQRTLTVRINGDVAVQGVVPTDEVGSTTGTLDGTYQGAKVRVDCSSQQKVPGWIEIRCRVIVNNEIGVTLVM